MNQTGTFTHLADGQWKCPRCELVFTFTEKTNGQWVCPQCKLHITGVVELSPHAIRPGRQIIATKGPGTELKRLFARFGFEPIAGCNCTNIAADMDRLGPEWCRANVDKLVGQIFQQAKKRKLPLTKFSRPAIKVFVRWAIRRAEKTVSGTPRSQRVE